VSLCVRNNIEIDNSSTGDGETTSLSLSLEAADEDRDKPDDDGNVNMVIQPEHVAAVPSEEDLFEDYEDEDAVGREDDKGTKDGEVKADAKDAKGTKRKADDLKRSSVVCVCAQDFVTDLSFLGCCQASYRTQSLAQSQRRTDSV